MNQIVNRNSAAILCSHVADGSHPMLLVVRTEPENKSDSGWQVLCNAHEENWENAKVWSISEVLQHEPSLEDHIDAPPGTTIVRDGVSSEWEVAE